jgi:photosystem II stability/assembly factor-like uncharacterized protein
MTAQIFAGAAALGAGTKGGLYRRAPGDSAWTTVTEGLPANVDARVILPDPKNHGTIFVGTQDGPYRSTDFGATWHRLNFPDRNAVIWSLTIHPTRPNVMFAGTAPIALYRSLDSGASWHRLVNAVSPCHCEREGFDSRVLRITVDPNRPDDIYAALEVSGVLRSTDGGETWADMSAPLIKLADQPHLHSNVGGRHCGHCEGILDSHATAVSAAAPDTVFLGIRMGLFRSDDRGKTWYDTEIGRFSPLTYCHDVIVSRHDPKVLYTCLSPAAMSEDGTLYRSDNLGETWTRFDPGTKAAGTLMAVCEDVRDPKRVYTVTRCGQVFGTEDGGASWQEYQLPPGVVDAYAVGCV